MWRKAVSCWYSSCKNGGGKARQYTSVLTTRRRCLQDQGDKNNTKTKQSEGRENYGRSLGLEEFR
jgi:hypothetical protein